jgi:hypothetical protein
MGKVCQRSALVDNLDDPIKIKSTDGLARYLISHKWLRRIFCPGLGPRFYRYQNQILMLSKQIPIDHIGYYWGLPTASGDRSQLFLQVPTNTCSLLATASWQCLFVSSARAESSQ